MKRINIACIVEGEGDAKAVPILLRRIVREIDPTLLLNTAEEAIKVDRSKIVKPEELERYVELAAENNAGHGGILILVDADEDCPAALAPQLLQRAHAARSDMPIAVVLAQREYEAWFLAAAQSLQGKKGLSAALKPPSDPEAVPGAKEWLRKHMEGSRKYSETVDQPALTRVFDLNAARQTASFDKLWRDVERLLFELEPRS